MKSTISTEKIKVYSSIKYQVLVKQQDLADVILNCCQPHSDLADIFLEPFFHFH